MPKVLFTGHDQIVKALGPLVVAALETHKGVEAHWICAATGEDENLILDMMDEIDILALNPASKDRNFDAFVLESARLANKRVAVVSDTWQAWRRIAPELRRQVAGLTVCFPNEVAQALAGGYTCPITAIIPPHWGEMYDGIKDARVVDPSEMLPVTHRGNARRGAIKIVYFGGAKNPPLMNKILRALAAAMPADGVLCFRPHPAEGASEATLAERAAFLAGVPMLDHKAAGLDNSNVMVANADASVFVGGPTDSIGGAYARKPMLYFWSDGVREHNLAQSLPGGKWFVPERGGALLAWAEILQDRLALLLTTDGLRPLQRSQEKNFPLPASWDTAPALASAILGA